MQYIVEFWVNGGGMFYGLVCFSVVGILIIVVLYGLLMVGGVYQLGMSDYVIGVKKNGMVVLVGVVLVKVVIGEVVEDVQFGGLEMYVLVFGLVEYLVEDDSYGFDIVCDLIG